MNKISRLIMCFKKAEEAKKERERHERDNQFLKEQITELKEDYHALLYLIEKVRKLGTDDNDRSSSVFKIPLDCAYQNELKA